ncbi:MAG: ferritin-like domain-containing protein [Bacteroidota bacterium]|nr:ferritin-like domain-containing protein [Bacteroidota bacterium]
MKSSTSKSANSATNTPSKQKSTKSNSDVAQGLRSLFEDELKDIYWAEKTLTKAIPKMIKNATSQDLINALKDHLEVTKGQVARCEQVFEILGKPARAKKCEAMAGLTKEAEEIMSSTEEGMVRDAGIISAGQKVEHYEIASYGTLCAFAKTLGEDEIANLLELTLNEEKEADQTLTTVAESSINLGAANADDSEENNKKK